MKLLLDCIYLEFLKIKRSSIILITIISGLIMPLFMDLAVIAVNERNRTFESYVYNIEMANLIFIYGIVFSLIAGYIFYREHSEKTCNVIYSSPVSRKKIFAAKLLVTYVLMCIVYIIDFTAVYLGYYFIIGPIENAELMVFLKASVYSLILECSVIPISIFIINISRNMMILLSYVVISAATMSVLSSEHYSFINYIPMLSPFLSLKNLYYPGKAYINTVIICACISFIFFIVISVYQYINMDYEN